MESWIFRNRSRLLAIYDAAPRVPEPLPIVPSAPAPPSHPAARVLEADPDGLDGDLAEVELLPRRRPPRDPAPPPFE